MANVSFRVSLGLVLVLAWLFVMVSASATMGSDPPPAAANQTARSASDAGGASTDLKAGIELFSQPTPVAPQAAQKLAREKRLLRDRMEQSPPAAYHQAVEAFKGMCAECHGQSGYGDGPRHTTFIPPPANLSLVNDSPIMARSIVHGGVPGTMMSGSPRLSDETIDNILTYVGLQPRDLTNQWAYPWQVHAETHQAIEHPNLEAGRLDYTVMCLGCHGPSGKGDGVMAQNKYLWPKPADLTARSSDAGRLYYIISEGRRGTFMPAFQPVVPEQSRWELARYVGSLYDVHSSASMRRPAGKVPALANPHSPNDQKVVSDGQMRYDIYCAGCHGVRGRGTFSAPRLIDRDWKIGNGTDTDVFTIVEEGLPGKLMMSFRELSADERWSIITFVRSNGGLPDPLATSAGQQRDNDQESSKSAQEGEQDHE